ncbi:ABC transporter ATP-binding protein, partial [Leucobacter sp. M11]|uniref:ABC transporter ATP-binding protein n=1 Tax=Leucobacter sp. M11 TaxID=2993565 RepID=UPI002D811074
MTLLRLTLKYARPQAGWILGVLVFQLIATVAALSLPGLNAVIIDRGVAAGDPDVIWSTGGTMLLICGIQLLSAVAGVVLGARAATQLGRDLRRAVYTAVDGLGTEQVAAFGVPTLLTRSTNDVQQVQMLVLMTLNTLVSAPIMCVGGIVLALREDVSLAWLVWSSVLLLTIVVGGLVLWVLPMFRELQGRIDEINGVLREHIVGVRTVRAFVREAHEAERYRRVNEALTRVSVRVGQVFVLLFPAISMVLHLASAAVLWFGGHQVAAGELHIGSLTAFLQYLIQILVAVMTAVFMVMMIPRAVVAGERITELLSASGTPWGDGQASVGEQHRVAFTGVSYGYPGAEEPVLRDISFSVPPGTTTAIVGATGSGKSTIVGLLAGFTTPSRGRVRIGDADPAELPRADRGRVIGLVPQRAMLFSGTVASNLRVADSAADEAGLWAALEVAQAADFVRALPGGLEAPIAQGGRNLSGGQRQRLCIARA